MDPASAPRSVARHLLAGADFDTLARGEGSRRITGHFLTTEESRRRLLVIALLRRMAQQPAALGPLCPVHEVADVLVAAEEAAPDAFRRLLLDPGVGSGLAYALRRLRGGASSAVPLWVDLGVVHALALVAAARAGVDWSARLPVRDGTIMIHTMGMARFPGTAEPTVEARAESGRIRFSDGRHELLAPADPSDVDPVGDGPGWWALRTVQVGDDLRLRVRIDDLDWLRDLADPVPPARLDEAAFERWRRLIDDAWQLLCRDYRAEAEAMVDGVTQIVPLKHLPGHETRSASNGEAFGSVMLDEPPDAVTTAVSLIHEYKHIQLGALLHMIPLTGPDDGSLYYAPWRDDPRPLPGLVQGIYAFFGIAAFWRIRRDKVAGKDRDLAAFEYAFARRQTQESVQIALTAPGLTPEGRKLFQALSDRVEEWAREPVDDRRIDRLAHLTAIIHRVGWRLRHCRPDGEDVAALAKRLLHREGPGVTGVLPAAIHPHPDLLWRQRIPAVARRQAAAGGDVTAARDTLARAENALVAHDARAALDAFVGALDELEAGRPGVPDDEARAWAGIAASLATEGDTPAAAVLTRRPDLVRAIYAEAAAHRAAIGTPVEIAAWLAPVLTDER